MGGLLNILISIPIVWLVDWFAFLNKLPPLAKELTRASHGVFMMLAAAALAYGNCWLGCTYLVPGEYQQWILPSLGFIGLWGLFWLVVGAARSRYYRDYHLLGRAAAKVILGGALWYWVSDWPRDYNWQLWGWYGAMVCVAWCLVTGLTKSILLLRPLPRLAIDDIDQKPHGDADFGDSEGLR
jgi:hypothetical protein